MNKLISRNPVLRFKLGRKIIKAQNSWGRNFNKYGYFGGIEKNWKGTKGLLDSGTLGKLQEMGFTYTDEDKNKNEIAKRALEFLNKFSSENNSLFSNSQIATDNAWGKLSKYALNTLYDLWKELSHTQTPKLSPTQTPEFLEGLRQQFIKEETPEQLVDRTIVNNVDNLQFKRNGNYNKSGIRDLIRSYGLKAYDFTGSLRKALRQYLNGESNDTSLLTNGLERFIVPYKQGGQLPSRNIIERFKQGKKLIKAQGGLDNTFKLLSDTAERTAEREQYWSDEEARKARAAYDRQMKSSKKSKKKAGRLQTYKGLPIVEIDGLGRGAIENADGSYTWVDVKDFDGQNIQDAIPFESTIKNYPMDLAQIPEVSGITFVSKPKIEQTTPVIDISKVPSTGKFYNRADVRDYMRRHGVNAYSYTSDYRKALRKVLNGQGTESDYNMVRAMGLKLKKGGLLPSRNSIQRFKNRKFN